MGLHVPAALLAWLWPGLGHRSLGHRRRSRYLCFGVLFLVFVGILIGGIDAVDHRNDRLWFIAQVCCGPVVIAIDTATQYFVAGSPIDKRVTMVGLSHVNEIGTLFVAMAGLMNFVVILDALCAKRHMDIERRDQMESTP